MNRNARDAYLENEVLTATPQRLRMMLLDGAWRFCVHAREAISSGQPDAAEAPLDRAHQILTEIISGIRPGYEISKSVAGIYVFLIRELTTVRSTRSLDALAGVIDVLEIERETWRQLCAAMPQRVAGDTAGPQEILSRDAERILSKRAPVRSLPAVGITPSASAAGSFQLDA